MRQEEIDTKAGADRLPLSCIYIWAIYFKKSIFLVST